MIFFSSYLQAWNCQKVQQHPSSRQTQVSSVGLQTLYTSHSFIVMIAIFKCSCWRVSKSARQNHPTKFPEAHKHLVEWNQFSQPPLIWPAVAERHMFTTECPPARAGASPNRRGRITRRNFHKPTNISGVKPIFSATSNNAPRRIAQIRRTRLRKWTLQHWRLSTSSNVNET